MRGQGLRDRAIRTVLGHEGWGVYTDDPADPGGATRWGISLRFLRGQGRLVGDIDGDGDVDAADIKALTRSQAVDLYGNAFWDRYDYRRFFEGDLAIKTFDLAVNMGPKAAHRCLQRALRAVAIEVVDDGVLGPKTLAAVNSANGKVLIVAVRSEAAGYYRILEARRPPFKRFIEGWLNRAYS